MRNKKDRKKKILVSLAIILMTGVFFVNWFLTYRLEGFLRNELSAKVSEATNGFYKLSFDKLSVGLFSGELKIEGLNIEPDSLTFGQWAANDTLPDVYFKINIGTIDFRGVNLVWHSDYRKLHFDLFEIKKPDIQLYRIRTSPDNDTTENKKLESLYDAISPYFDVINARRINLENATFVYTISDSIAPAVYALRDVSFHAYRFLLDEKSSSEGKLLYCDNFDFTTNRKQKILDNNQFILNAESVILNTRDSVIRIKGVELLPQKELWKKTNNFPSNFAGANIDSVNVEGIVFKRRDKKSFFKARSLNVSSSKIEYVTTDNNIQNERTTHKEHSLTKISLYKTLSPILYSVAIDRIEVDKTNFRYTTISEKGNDTYSLYNFDFWANDFLVDSVTDTNHKIMYSDNFGFEATNFEGEMNSKNYRLKIENIALDTYKGTFGMKGVKVAPISTKDQYDYLSGTIDLISLTGLKKEDGISAKQLLIESPDINYTITESKNKVKPSTNKTKQAASNEKQQHTIDMLTSLSAYYAINDIVLNNADFVYQNQNKDNGETIKINGLNFSASDFVVDKNTCLNMKWYFNCSDFKFSLNNFDNYILDNKYRLSFDNIHFTGMKGKLQISNLSLIPQESTWGKAPDEYLKFVSPLLEATGLDYKNNTLKIGGLSTISPQIKYTKERTSNKNQSKNTAQKTNSTPFIKQLLIGRFNVSHANLEFTDKTTGSELHSTLAELNVSETTWNISDSRILNIKDIKIRNPRTDYRTMQTKQPAKTTKNTNKTVKENNSIEQIKIGTTFISDFKLKSATSGTNIQLDLDKMQLSDLDWKPYGNNSYFSTGNIDISDPSLNVISRNKENQPKQNKNELNKKQNIYQLLKGFSDRISIGYFNLTNGNIAFNQTDTENDSIQKINSVGLTIKQLDIDNISEKLDLDDIGFSVKDISFPVDKGFYTVNIKALNLSERGEKIQIDGIHLKSRYPKLEFADKHYQNKDWFDVTARSFTASGIDVARYFSEKILYVNNIRIEDARLDNYKNQKIEIQHNIMPMIYEVVQKAPVKFDVKNMDVKNITVVYEELAKKADKPGILFFTDMNGHFTGFTNRVSEPEQYIKLDADGKLMGKGYFTAQWNIPVDQANDRFLLNAHLHHFDMKELNQLIQPMAPAKIASGRINDITFDIDASSIGANIKMQLLYDSLKIDLMRTKDGELVNNKFLTRMTNLILKGSNPRKKGKSPISVDIYVERDPYHSTFNYLFQILQPAITETVGVSQKGQNLLKNLPQTLQKISNFFWKTKQEIPQQAETKNRQK